MRFRMNELEAMRLDINRTLRGSVPLISGEVAS
jgi:hypothetical protein